MHWHTFLFVAVLGRHGLAARRILKTESGSLTEIELSKAPNACVDVNTASANALTSIEGIGDATAKAIRDRDCYDRIEDLVESFQGSKNFQTIQQLALGPDPQLCVMTQCIKDEECVDLNAASMDALIRIKGIGKSTARAILDFGCFESIEDFIEEFRGRRNFQTLRDLALGPHSSLCVKTQCAAPVQCVDLNTASIGAMSALEGIGQSTARKIRDGRCYDGIDDFKDTFKAMNNWHRLEALINSGEICVDSDCAEHDDGDEDANGAEEAPEDAEMTLPSDEPLHERGDELHVAQTPLEKCDEKKLLPPVRAVEDSHDTGEVLNKMVYAVFVPRSRKGIFDFVDETPERRKRCTQMFPSLTVPTSSDKKTFDASVGVCVLVKLKRQDEMAMEYSEYNTVRNVPNFVAYKLLNHKAKFSSKQCRVDWMTVCPKCSRGSCSLQSMKDRCEGLVDFHFGPSAISNLSCPVNDYACDANPNTRGHLRPIRQTASTKEMCSATMNFVNAVPTRNDKVNPFDGRQWGAREDHLMKYLEAREASGSLPAVWVVVGTSKESDGKVQSKRKSCNEKGKCGIVHEVHVPSFLWTAVYDPSHNMATGWLCRNGLSPKDECHCVDKLSMRDLEARVGYRIFPQLEGMEGLDLSDGSHHEFWHDLNQPKERKPSSQLFPPVGNITKAGRGRATIRIYNVADSFSLDQESFPSLR